MEINNSS